MLITTSAITKEELIEGRREFGNLPAYRSKRSKDRLLQLGLDAHKEKREITKKNKQQNKKEKLASKYHYCDLKLLGIDKNFTNAVLIEALRKAR